MSKSKTNSSHDRKTIALFKMYIMFPIPIVVKLALMLCVPDLKLIGEKAYVNKLATDQTAPEQSGL